MKKKRSNKKAIIVTISAVALVAIIVIAFFGNSKEKPISVNISQVERKTITQIVSATGTIQPETQVKISPEVSGEVVNLPVKEGDFVEKGLLLARINPAVLESQLEQYKASVNVSREDVKASKVQSENLAVELKRAKELYDKKFISKQELDQAQTSYDATYASYLGAEARLKASEASLKQVQEEFQKTSIFAPIDGVVTSLLIEKNERVVGTNMMTGTEMMTVSDLAVMNAMVDVDENDIILVKVGDTATIEVDAILEKTYKGVVVEVGHSAKAATAVGTNQTISFTVKIRLIDAELKLRPGMSCNVEIQTEKKENVLAVPLQAVTSRENKLQTDVKNTQRGEISKQENSQNPLNKPTTMVFLAKGDKAETRNVEVGISDMGFIEIISGLKEGEKIVSGSYQAVSKLLENGSKIQEEKANNKLEKTKPE
jgi:HlyD family secretion protein